MKLVLQPCGDSVARAHFVDTIANPVPIDRLATFLTAAELELVRSTFGTSAAIWGVTPAKNGSNARQWSTIELGDTALLYRDKSFFFRATVAFKTHNRALAEHLWSRTESGETWEYVFFLNDLEPISLSIEVFNRAVGFAPNFVVQRFLVLNEEKSASAIYALDLPDWKGAAADSASDSTRLLAELANLAGSSDALSEGVRRREQALLRRILLRNRQRAECAICGRDLPVDLLVVGHIKRRSSSDERERRMLANVMPICVLGCDSLFEHGYVFIDEAGKARTRTGARLSPDLAEILSSLEGKTCLAWSEESAPLFAWHRTNHRRFL